MSVLAKGCQDSDTIIRQMHIFDPISNQEQAYKQIGIGNPGVGAVIDMTRYNVDQKCTPVERQNMQHYMMTWRVQM